MPTPEPPATLSHNAPRGAGGSKYYAIYVLVVLSIANAFNSIDRTVVGLLAESIKQELQISDTAIGLLSGFAFLLLYSVLGIPIARWSDRGVRRSILAMGIGFWSAMTALCGTATSFLQLLLYRVGVGVGEAAAVPPALSLIADYFRKENRPIAVAIFQSSLYGGLLIGSLYIGWIVQSYDWRIAFLALGVPGIAWALLVRFTVREPVRGALDGAPPAENRSLREALGLIFASRALLLLLASAAVMMFAAQGLLQWSASFLRRVHGLTAGEAAAAVGPMLGLGGLCGALIGGVLTSWLVKRTKDERWMMYLPGAASVIAAPLQLVFLLSGNIALVLAAGAAQVVFTSMKMGPTFSLALELVPSDMRALVASVMLLFTAIVGNGCGPFVVGFVSDLLAGSYPLHSLRYAMLCSPAALIVGAILLLLVAFHLPGRGSSVQK